jgi:GNAT superfamily N-acetyltransferase
VPAEGARVEELRDACLRELRGWTVVAPVELAHALMEAGATQRRHATLMTHELRHVPAEIDPRVVPLTLGASDLLPAYRSAYKPDHPDYAVASQADPLGRLMGGELIGPVLACSRMAVVEDQVVGAAIVNDFPGEPPDAGPWLAEIFRDPEYAGVGRALLRGVLKAAAADHRPALGLVVSGGNPAAGLYRDEGFRVVREDISVDVPGSIEWSGA